eukprot:gene6498-3136_t
MEEMSLSDCLEIQNKNRGQAGTSSQLVEDCKAMLSKLSLFGGSRGRTEHHLGDESDHHHSKYNKHQGGGSNMGLPPSGMNPASSKPPHSSILEDVPAQQHPMLNLYGAVPPRLRLTLSGGGANPASHRSWGTPTVSVGGHGEGGAQSPLTSPMHQLPMRRVTANAVPRLDFSSFMGGEASTPTRRRLPTNSTNVVGQETEQDLLDELDSYSAPAKWDPSNQGRWFVYKPVTVETDDQGRWFVYMPATVEEVKNYEALVASLPRPQALLVAELWEAHIQARYSCELMASRAVRIAKDVNTSWSRIADQQQHVVSETEGYVGRLKKYISGLKDDIQVLQHKTQGEAHHPQPHQQERQGPSDSYGLQQTIDSLAHENVSLMKENCNLSHQLDDAKSLLMQTRVNLEAVQEQYHEVQDQAHGLYSAHHAQRKAVEREHEAMQLQIRQMDRERVQAIREKEEMEAKHVAVLRELEVLKRGSN